MIVSSSSKSKTSPPDKRRRNSHVICESDLSALVPNDREGELRAGDLINVLDPATVALDRVGRQADELCTALGEFRLELGKCTELSGANWSVILGVREEDYPFVADELVEVDWAIGGLGLEVGGLEM